MSLQRWAEMFAKGWSCGSHAREVWVANVFVFSRNRNVYNLHIKWFIPVLNVWYLYIVIHPSITWIFSSFLGQSSGSEPFMSWFWQWLQWFVILVLRIVGFSIFQPDKESLLFLWENPRLENTNLSWEIVVDQEFHILWSVRPPDQIWGVRPTDQTGLFQGW